MTALDDCGQPWNTGFNGRRNAKKSLLTLRGILYGVVADKLLNEKEILFLDNWLKNQRQADMEGDMLDVCEVIAGALKDGMIASDELNDIENLISDVLEFGCNDEDTYAAQLNQMFGYLLGITADNELNEMEITGLQQRLKLFELFDWPLGSWCGDVLARRISEILVDGVITAEEKDDLLETIKQIASNRFNETGIAHGLSTEFCAQSLESFDFCNANICFTGKFISGTRQNVETIAKTKGAVICKSVTQKLNLLVIGTIASKDWKYTSLGGKIEKAIELQCKGNPVKIVTEKTWLKLIGD